MANTTIIMNKEDINNPNHNTFVVKFNSKKK